MGCFHLQKGFTTRTNCRETKLSDHSQHCGLLKTLEIARASETPHITRIRGVSALGANFGRFRRKSHYPLRPFRGHESVAATGQRRPRGRKYLKILALRHAFWRHFSVFARKKTGIEMISTPGLRWCETNPLRTRFETIGKQGLPLRKEHPVEPALANAIFKMQQSV